MSEAASRLHFETIVGFLFVCFPCSQLWKTTVELPRGVPVWYRYFKGYFLEPKVCTTVLL